MAVPVTAEWALWGKEAYRDDYQVLECSAGPVSWEDFHKLLTWYSPGKLETWPQVTISWCYREQECYLGIAIYDRPEPGRYDVGGREIALTRYFCMPFRELAAGAVSYQAMFKSFQRVELRPGNRSPLRTELAVWQPGASPGGLA